MKDTYSILCQLGETSSRKEKEAILTREKDNTLLMRVFASAYNPHINYWIKKIPEVTYESPIRISLNHALDKLDDLANRTVTGNAAIARLSQILGELSPTDRAVLSWIVLKDLRCGVSEATINKIWKGLIPSYPCLLASADDPKARAKIKFPAIAQEKCDGMRINVLVKSTGVSYKSRNGKDVDCGSPELDKQCAELSHLLGGEYMLDGELLCWDKAKGAPMPRKIGNGICNKAIKGTVSDKERDLFIIVIWDVVPMKDFERGKCSGGVPYRQRLKQYENAFADMIETRIFAVPSWRIDSWEQAKVIYNAVVAQGKEGLIIKNMKGVWEDKRSADLVKMKEEREIALRVVGVLEGTGKNIGKLGALVCESGGDNPVSVNVGTGFSDEERELYSPSNSKNIVGKIISIVYNEIIVAEDGSRSLFLPRFDQIREDKDVPDVV